MDCGGKRQRDEGGQRRGAWPNSICRWSRITSTTSRAASACPGPPSSGNSRATPSRNLCCTVQHKKTFSFLFI